MGFRVMGLRHRLQYNFLPFEQELADAVERLSERTALRRLGNGVCQAHHCFSLAKLASNRDRTLIRVALESGVWRWQELHSRPNRSTIAHSTSCAA